jgi:hypothetical protein
LAAADTGVAVEAIGRNLTRRRSQSERAFIEQIEIRAYQLTGASLMWISIAAGFSHFRVSAREPDVRLIRWANIISLTVYIRKGVSFGY